jgi:hypothetical protein
LSEWLWHVWVEPDELIDPLDPLDPLDPDDPLDPEDPLDPLDPPELPLLLLPLQATTLAARARTPNARENDERNVIIEEPPGLRQEDSAPRRL